MLEAGHVSPGDTLDRLRPATGAPTLREAQLLWQEHRPALSDLERLAQVPGIATGWREKIIQRLAWLKGSAR